MRPSRFARLLAVGALGSVLGSLLLVVPQASGAPLGSSRLVAAGATAAVRAAPGRTGPGVRDVPVVLAARTGDTSGSSARTAPTPVNGYGVVGATWTGPAPDGLLLHVRTRTHGAWSAWTPLEVDPDGGDVAAPGPVRAGTAPLGVGRVDAVQLEAATPSGRLPRDLRLSVVDPGPDPEQRAGGSRTADRSRTDSERTRGVRAPRPEFFTRADWGANPRLRSGQPRYGRVKVGFVHHTVNANDYRRRDVPALIRGIYAYHTRSRGWSDIGYNFVVDRFGRTWVGRAGGARQPVVGAQVLHYNHLSTGIAVIGNFETARPRRAVLRALGRMMGWKLGMNGVAAADRTRMRGHGFQTISGHRDGGQTACPGRYLYAQLPRIRVIAARWQRR